MLGVCSSRSFGRICFWAYKESTLSFCGRYGGFLRCSLSSSGRNQEEPKVSFLSIIQSFPFISLVVPIASFLSCMYPNKNLCRLWVGIGSLINALGFYAYGYVNDTMWKSYIMAPLWLLLAVAWFKRAFWVQRWEREKEAIMARWRT